MRYIMFPILLFSVGCMSDTQLARRCADRFPCSLEVTMNDTTITIDTIIQLPRLVVSLDSVRCGGLPEFVIVEKQIVCQGDTLFLPRRVIRTTVIVTDSARVVALRDSLRRLHTSHGRMIAQRDNYRLYFFIALAAFFAILSFCLWRYRGNFDALVNPKKVITQWKKLFSS